MPSLPLLEFWETKAGRGGFTPKLQGMQRSHRNRVETEFGGRQMVLFSKSRQSGWGVKSLKIMKEGLMSTHIKIPYLKYSLCALEMKPSESYWIILILQGENNILDVGQWFPILSTSAFPGWNLLCPGETGHQPSQRLGVLAMGIWNQSFCHQLGIQWAWSSGWLPNSTHHGISLDLMMKLQALLLPL